MCQRAATCMPQVTVAIATTLGRKLNHRNLSVLHLDILDTCCRILHHHIGTPDAIAAMSLKKLQQEIDKTFKKVDEGIEAFNSIYEKIYSSQNASQKDKLEE